MPVSRRTRADGLVAISNAFRVGLAVVGRPRLWPAALRAWGGAVPAGWWRRAPFVPWPDRDYLAWRLHTAYGEGGVPRPADIVGYLEWCRVARGGAHLIPVSPRRRPL